MNSMSMKKLTVECIKILYRYQLLDEIPKEHHQLVAQLVKEDVDTQALKIQSPMKLSIDDYIDILAETLGLSAYESSFWIVVIKIVWHMLLIEKDPNISSAIRESKHLKDYLKSFGG